jgi:hypothetical protein
MFLNRRRGRWNLDFRRTCRTLNHDITNHTKVSVVLSMIRWLSYKSYYSKVFWEVFTKDVIYVQQYKTECDYLICMLFIDYYNLEHNSNVISDLLNVIFKNNLIVCVKELRKLCTHVNAIEIPTKLLLMDHLVSVEQKINSWNSIFCVILMGFSLF